MRVVRTLPAAALVALCGITQAEPPAAIKPYVRESAALIVLDHVRVIDGTGAPPVEDQRVEIQRGLIVRMEPSSSRRSYPADASILNLSGKSIIPGLIGMHEHLFYPAPRRPAGGLLLEGEMAESAPRLYLAGGVTTARTAGSVAPYTDLSLKKMIDAGQAAGPKLRITGPYLDDAEPLAPQLHGLTGPEDAGRTVDYWADEGATSFKAYTSIKSDELKVAIEHAHARGLKVTGHLCSIGFREAAALGIDNLEHGIVIDGEFYPGKKPDVCFSREAQEDLARNVAIDSAPVRDMIQDLVAHHVAVTSTLAVFETFIPNRPPMLKQARAEQALTLDAWVSYLQTRSAIAEENDPLNAVLVQKEMQFERAFVKAGGLLMAGCDPTGYGGVLPGYGDQRGGELLVEAGFTPLEAIHIATQNGAVFLGEDATIGSIAVGKAADLVVIEGNPAASIDDIERVEIVFKDGIGYDPVKLTQSVQHLVGLR